MAWTTPITATANSIFSASQWNAGVRDNLNETAPFRATTSGRLIVSNGANTIAEREVAQASNDASGTTSSTTFTTTLTGGGTTPAVTVTTGTGAIIFISLNLHIDTANTALAGVSQDADTPSTGRCIMVEGATTRDDRMGITQALLAGSAGSHTFDIRYRVTGGGPGTFINRRIVVMAL